MIRRVAGACIASAVLVSGAASQDAQLVKDIRPGGGNSNPSEFLAVGGKVYFAANDGDKGNELWVSDGTEDGTVRVRDIDSGGDNSNPGELYHWNGVIYFAASGGGKGRELWKSDGTEDGTVRLKDINSNGDSNPREFTEFIDSLYFTATNQNFGRELWRTDGTSGGTERASDINPGIFDSDPEQLTATTIELLFSAQTQSMGRELFKVFRDDDDDKLQFVKDINNLENSQIDNLTALNSLLIFSAKGVSGGNEPWVSDGTGGDTKILKNIDDGGSGSNPGNFLRIGNTVFFAADDGERGMELYATNGTTESTGRVKNINSGGADSSPMHLEESGGILYFSAKGEGAGRELWRSDGTEEGTYLVKDIRPNGASDPEEIVAFGTGVAFIANDGETGRELWYSDGTEEGTRRVSDIVEGSGDAKIENLTPAGSILFFSADIKDSGRELWKYERDLSPPSCIAISPQTIGPTNATSIEFTFQFDEPVINFDGEEDLIISHSGTSHGSLMFETDDNITYSVTVGDLGGAGTFTVRAETDPDETDVEDLSGNELASTVVSLEVSIDTLPPLSVCSVTPTQIGGQVVITVTSVDGTGSNIQSVGLWGRRDSENWEFLGDISDFNFPLTPETSGRYFFQSVAVDAVANNEAPPSEQGDATLVYNQMNNGSITVTPITGDEIVFPMTSQSSVVLDFANATPSTSVTMERHVPEANVPPSLDPANLIDESLTITGDFTGTVGLRWTYDPVSDDSLGGIPNIVYSSNGIVRKYSASLVGNTLSVEKINGFSEWFAGRTEFAPEHWVLE